MAGFQDPNEFIYGDPNVQNMARLLQANTNLPNQGGYAGGLLNGLSQAVAAYGYHKAVQGAQARQKAMSDALINASVPNSVAVSPQAIGSDIPTGWKPAPDGQRFYTPEQGGPSAPDLQRGMTGGYSGFDYNAGQDLTGNILRSGNSDLVAALAPSIVNSRLTAEAQAHQPITPYQQASIGIERGTQALTQQRMAQEQANADRTFNYNQSQHTPEALAAAAKAEAEAKFPTEAKLAQIKSDASSAAMGPFGRSMLGKAYGILAQGVNDPAIRSTPEYMTAWQIASNPTVDPNTGTMVRPDMTGFVPPSAPGQAPAPGAQGAPAAAPSPGLPPRTPSVQSYAPPNPSQPEAAAAGYAKRMQTSAAILDDPSIVQAMQSPMKNFESRLPLGNYVVGTAFQKGDQAQRDFINAVLRRESGAVISDEEFANARKQYLPQMGDSPEVIRQKKANRDTVLQNMLLSAGNAALPPGVVQQSSPPANAPMVPMSQGFSVPGATGQPKILKYNPQTGKLE